MVTKELSVGEPAVGDHRSVRRSAVYQVPPWDLLRRGGVFAVPARRPQ